MQNAGSRSFLGVKMFICKPIFNILWHFLRLLECKRMINHILLELFQSKVICKKAVVKGWCKESS